jgi:3-phenylpropionate/cinnamic acid dioxygenase small subunit
VSRQPAEIGFDPALYFRCLEFYNREAELLDANRVAEWLELIDPEIDYRIPIRITRERSAGLGFSESGYHMTGTYRTLQARVDRFESEYAWGDDPPSRTRRFVSNLRVRLGEDDRLEVKSNLLVYRGRFDSPSHQLISAERDDALRQSSDGLRLLRRTVLLDHSTLATGSLGILL